ncbi:MAG TPA: SAM-dependent methyltransferase [Gammaproteobacteria bacterium]|nr:SAM-dependent methyltransferase [Gammaproteobacteria bacterium]
MATKHPEKWEYGDFQTPDALARAVVGRLAKNHGIAPRTIIEPTCGEGAFVRAALEEFPDADVVAFDINGQYVKAAREQCHSTGAGGSIYIKQADFFSLDWDEILSNIAPPILVLGNPPWVTSSELSALNSKNLPAKSNFQGRRGIEAITGAANFDISEWMLLRHVRWLSRVEGTIALLCKYSVARKVMRQIQQNQEQRLFGHIYFIDAKRHFGASVAACLFVLTTDRGNADCEVYDDMEAASPAHVIGGRDGLLVKDVDSYAKWRHLRGQDSRHIWRSGMKHDCSKVMELEPLGNGMYRNGLHEDVRIELHYLFPLLKSSDIGNSRIKTYRKVVLVPQRKAGEDTSSIQSAAPKTWDYLQAHDELLAGRKSSIYKNKPAYSVFGIGDYSFKPWKVAISGFYKHLKFHLVGPMENKPVIFDDTISFLGFDTKAEAQFIHDLLASEPAHQFLASMIFWDEKRPITTTILRRLCLKSLSIEVGRSAEYLRWCKGSSIGENGQQLLAIGEQRAPFSTHGSLTDHA